MTGKTAVEQRYTGTVGMNNQVMAIKEVGAMMERYIYGLAKNIFSGPKALAEARRNFYAYHGR